MSNSPVTPTLDPPLSGALGDRVLDEFARPNARFSTELARRTYNLKSVLLDGFSKRGNSWEREISEELQREHPNLAIPGTAIPFASLSRRDLSVSGGLGTGGAFVETLIPPSIADALLPVSMVVGSGCTVLQDLRGDVSIPRWSLPSSPAVLSEMGAITASDPNSQAITLTPHRVSTRVIISRQLLLQASMSLEDLLRREILRSIGALIDWQALNGSGVSPAPLGLLSMPVNAPGGTDLNKLAPPITFGGPATWDSLVAFETTVRSANVADDGTLSWGLSPLTKDKWSRTPKIAGYPSYLCEGNMANGYPLRVSGNLASSKQALFARWSDVILALWALSIVNDNLSLAISGSYAITVTIFMDIQVLRGPAVAISTDSAEQ